ncbi:MAG: hypothetical protein ACRC1H_11960, partial [Caldilineaceae bacterium]
PTQAALSGYAIGDAIRQQMMQRAQAQEQARRAAEAEQFIGSVMSSPNATLEQYAQVLTLNPKLRESVELVTKRRSEEQNAVALRDMGQVYSALTMQRPDVAKQLLERRAEALGNTPGAGEQRAMAQAMIEQLDADPVQVRNGLGVMLAAAPGGKDVLEGLAKLGAETRAESAFPVEQRKRVADATTAEAAALVAPEVAQAEARKKVADALTAEITSKYKDRLERAGLALVQAQTDNQRSQIDERKNAAGKPQTPPAGYRWTAAGELEPIPGGPASGVKGLTEAQAKATAFLGQMRAAETTLGGISKDQSSLAEQAAVAAAATPFNILSTPQGQQIRQAQDQWSESFLRFKTGAAATEDEVRRNVRTFFPQMGDSPQVIAQKQRMREQAVQDIATVAGKGADKALVVPSVVDAAKPGPRADARKPLSAFEK